MNLRSCTVKGIFYPSEKNELKELLESFNSVKFPNIKKDIRAILVPHAGYIYSGFTANLAYHYASKNNYKRIIVIGPSHNNLFENASVSNYDFYESPCGNLKIDKSYIKKLIEKFDFLFFKDEFHKEHSTEVQIPFIKHYFNNHKIIEIIYSKLNSEKLSNLLEYILEDKNNLLIISSDLSHFHSLQNARDIDNICLNAINNLDSNKLNYCEACGKLGIHSLIDISKKINLKSKILNYTTSAQTNKDNKSVVGYVSAIFYRQ